MNSGTGSGFRSVLRRWIVIIAVITVVFVAAVGWEFLKERRNPNPIALPNSYVDDEVRMEFIEAELDHEATNFMLIWVDPDDDDQLSPAFEKDALVGLALIGPHVQAEHVTALASHPTLQTLVLFSTKLRQDDLAAITDSNLDLKIHFIASDITQENTSQVRTKVTRCTVPPSDPPAKNQNAFLINAVKGSSLSVVDMRETVVSREAIETYTTHPNLTHFYVGYGFDDSMMDLLPRFKNLQMIDLSQSTATDASLEQLLHVPKLTTLVVGPNMTDAACQTLAKCKTLEWINASASQISEKGLVELKELESLKTLCLDGCPLSTSGLEMLSTFPSLERLHIRGCKVIGTQDIDAIIRMQKLKDVSVSMTCPMQYRLQTNRPNISLRP